MGSVKKDIFFNTLSNFLQFGTRWFLNVILAREFSSIFYGRFTLVYSLATLFSSLFIFGSNLFLLYKARGHISILIRSIILTVGIFLACLVVILLLFPKYLIVLLLALALSLNANLFSYYKGLGWFDKEAKLYFLFSFFLLNVIILVIKGLVVSINFLLVLLISVNFLIFLVGFLYICIYFSCKLRLRVNIIYLLRNELVERFTYGVHEFLSILFKNLEFILLSFYLGNRFLGEYKAVYNLVFPFYIIATITSQVLLSRLRTYVGVKKKFFLNKFVMLTGFIGVLLVYTLYELYPFMSEKFYGSEFIDTKYRILYLILLVNLFVYLVKSNYEVALTAIGKQKFRVKILLLSIFLFTLIDYIFIKMKGIIGHSMAILITYVFIFVIYAYRTKKEML